MSRRRTSRHPTDVGANNVYDVQVQVSDGTLTDTQAIEVTVTNVDEALIVTTINGTLGQQYSDRPSGIDIMDGLAGNDTLAGLGGADQLIGGARHRHGDLRGLVLRA